MTSSQRYTFLYTDMYNTQLLWRERPYWEWQQPIRNGYIYQLMWWHQLTFSRVPSCLPVKWPTQADPISGGRKAQGRRWRKRRRTRMRRRGFRCLRKRENWETAKYSLPVLKGTVAWNFHVFLVFNATKLKTAAKNRWSIITFIKAEAVQN